MKRNYYGSIGSVSTGTLRDADLLDAFLWEAKHLRLTKTERKTVSRIERVHDGAIEHDADCTYLGNGAWSCGHLDNQPDTVEPCDCDHCDKSADVEELFDILNAHSLPYFYFGAHPDADYGWWLGDIDDTFDGLRVSDTSEVPRGYTGEVLHVNDHGNMTLYSASRGRLHEVWGIV